MPKKMLIDDGREKHTTFPGWGLEKCDFSFRPALPERVHRYQQETTPGGVALHDGMVKLIKEYLTSWDVADDADETKVAKITEANIRKLPVPFQTFICDSICSFRGDTGKPKDAGALADEQVKNSPGASA